MRDQLAEQIATRPIHNRFPLIGLDIRQSPTQAMTRHLKLLAASEGPAKYQHDEKTLMCWDWQAWDHFIHCAERRLLLGYRRERSRRRQEKGVRA
jgi:hypothetical protein